MMLKLFLGALTVVCINQICITCLPSLTTLPASETDCICVPFYQCTVGEIITDGTGIINPRKVPKQLGIDEKYIAPRCGPLHVCCRKPSTKEVKPYEHRCGLRNPNGIYYRNANIKGEAEFGEFPYQAVVLVMENSDTVFKCGGTIIDDNHILTVAHCVEHFQKRQNDIVVRLGVHDSQRMDEHYPYEDYGVQQIVIHQNYNPRNLHNDVALLKLDRQIEFKPHIDSICLPRVDDKFTGKSCIVTGWGKKSWNATTYSNILKKVTVPVLSDADCQNKLRLTRLGEYFELHSGFICAGGNKGEDSCLGDGGGPLLCYREDGRYHLAGIVAWGIECGRDNHPGVYVEVQEYMDWIVSKTGRPRDSYYV